MKEFVNVYDDGKIGRGTNGEILKRGSKRILIRFYDDFNELMIDGWFVRVRRTQRGAYWHKPTNSWFYPFRETQKFIKESQEWLMPEYHNSLFAQHYKSSET